MRVEKVNHLKEYKLKLRFRDKKTKIVDLSDLVDQGGYYFEPLQSLEFFKQVSLDDEKYPLSICWPNGADICPDVLYEMGIEVKADRKAPFRRKRRSSSLASHPPKSGIAAKSKR